MKRLFTFGCSFTQYWRWPTWADALGQEYEKAENWGVCGGGNSLIFYSLVECHQRNQITADDDVYIMWTNTSREDRYVRDRWHAAGNIYWTGGNDVPVEYILKFACERGYLIRDLATITATRHMLDHIGCRYRFLSKVPLSQTNESVGLASNPKDTVGSDQDIRDLYQDTLDLIAPSVFEVVFKHDWNSRPGIVDPNLGRRDFHPTPMEHVEYLDQLAPGLITQDATREWMSNWQKQIESGNNDWDTREQWRRRPKRF
jgi:hypothetical protein